MSFTPHAQSGQSVNHANHDSGICALSIAGFDPSGGAGLLADIKTFEQCGVYGLGVVSALTWQNDVEFEAVEWIAAEKILSQVEVLLRRFDIKHIKIGLIENKEVLSKVVAYLRDAVSNAVIVFDPIIKASAGFDFHGDYSNVPEGIFCITPNLPEARQMLGEEGLEEKLEALSERVNIYLKGGHTEGSTCTDFLYTSDHTYAFSNERLPDGEKHGSGCVLSAALTARLALGYELPDAAEFANAYVYQFLASSPSLLGSHKLITV